MVRRWGVMLAVIVAIGVPMLAQDTEKAKADAWSFYKLQVTVREIDGTKVINSRNYDMSQRAGDWGQLRVGSRLPVVTAADLGGKTSQYQYIDVGLNIDSRVQDRGSDAAFDWRLNLSSAAPEPTPGGPVIRSVQSNGQLLLTLGKPMIMTSVDDLNSTHKFVFEVTATKVK